MRHILPWPALLLVLSLLCATLASRPAARHGELCHACTHTTPMVMHPMAVI